MCLLGRCGLSIEISPALYPHHLATQASVNELACPSPGTPGGPYVPPGGDIYRFANRWGSTNGSTFGVVSWVRGWQSSKEIQGNAVAKTLPERAICLPIY